MSELKKYFERLMDFARQSNFNQPFSQVYFVEDKAIQHSFDSNKSSEIFRENIFTFENYENRLNQILNQGHSWVNFNFAGMLDDSLLIIIELPNYKNNVPFESVSVNLSLPEERVIENDWKTTDFVKII